MANGAWWRTEAGSLRMDALILAAGLGSRLRPLTDRIPKALVEVGGIPMLDLVARRLIQAGADRLVINLHHLGDQIKAHVEAQGAYGVEVRFSEELEHPLETGGAILAAAEHLRLNEPFIVHNSDILSDLPLEEMYARHLQERPLATLAVMDRETRRYLLFDDVGLFGRVDEGKGIRLQSREPEGAIRQLAFGGVHVIEPDFPARLIERGVFSVLDPYLRLAGVGMRILPFRIDRYRWIDIGKPEQLEQAREYLRSPAEAE